MPAFFDRYPRFRETSVVGTMARSGQRLDWRWEAIVGANRALFDNARVLDLASHDGRWSMAALDAGAAHVTGIEGRASLVANALSTFGAYGIEPSRYHFAVGDVLTALPMLTRGDYDLVLNLGFLYHTPKHYEIFEQMRRLQPKAIILDTQVTQDDGALTRYRTEGTHWEGAAIGPGEKAVVAVPSHDFIAMMCDFFGYRLAEIDWHSLGVGDWAGLLDYRSGQRRTYVLTDSVVGPAIV
jgi:hypothetical protein